MNKIKLGVTGSSGFIGWHLKCYLSQSTNLEMLACDREVFNDDDKFLNFIKKSDVILHLAGLPSGNSPKELKINEELAERLTLFLEKAQKNIPIIYANSRKKLEDCPYGKSKLAVEKILEGFTSQKEMPFCNLIIPNIFGEEALPQKNSVIATFSDKLFKKEPPVLIEDRELDYLYTQDLCKIIEDIVITSNFKEIILPGYKIKTSDLLKTLKKFYDFYKINTIPFFENDFEENLYRTFVSYSGTEFQPEVHADIRGSLVEIVKTFGKGKTFISTTNTGYIRGGHFHFRKIEKMFVIKGSAKIILKKIFSEKVIIKNIKSYDNKIIIFPNFYEHSIENTGKEELIILFWANETENACSPDTYVLGEKNE
jgi:UDP-2-acetamido-2,6-beta-L-arabino-hexul-4-ose reductase